MGITCSRHSHNSCAVLLMDSNIEHQFEMERTRREVMACSDVDYMRQITLSVLDLMEGQRQFFIDHLLGHSPYGL